MDKELLEQINTWHAEENYALIVQRLEKLPESEQDYETIGQLARAYNNVQNYRKAIRLLYDIKDQGQADPLWQYRLGYAYYHIAEYKLAQAAFEEADRLDPHDESTLEFLDWIRPKAAKMDRDRLRWQTEQTEWEQNGTLNQLQAASGTYDPATFWQQSDYARDNHVSAPFDAELQQSIEQELGYILPASYIQLMNTQNGGVPTRTMFPTQESTSWAEDHIAITSILGIGRDKMYSLGGEFGSRFMIEDWGYPDLGVVICDCPSAGHDVVMLDYRFCGPQGEPCVVHVDQESDYEITYLAPNFEVFIRGLLDEEDYEFMDEEQAITAVFAENQSTTAFSKEAIAPFKFIDGGSGSYSVILNAGSYLQDVFDTRADEGFEGGGYDWASLAAVFLEEKMPHLTSVIRFDPEADMFCVYTNDKEALITFILGFKQACEQHDLIMDLFSRAELD
ncbi:SMI1/KNR4 family protein [Paenibacillus barcinonensis]|uniref:SMI1/KNR4 family protein n=1 Tax=Paenibacillus barcinonensis TaxID=198119 RepID=A0A2V4VHB1_PAEBA|nr:Imm51 family immunity protein [Paenibacillus barcinonensis]PYE44300.1 SUKH superfamily protein [Paenibacillus barcinonensis]QKS58303.1 SMI1/KNR4 family protein [Paenibacillus barcinonensis]